MKILNPEELFHYATCPCGAKLEYTYEDIQYSGTRFYNYEDFIVCPNCKKSLAVNVDVPPFRKEW